MARSNCARIGGLTISLIVWASLTASSSALQPEPRIDLAEQTDLASLVDLAAGSLGIDIEFDAKALHGQAVTLRLTEGLTAQELWQVTNQLLASRGFVVIRPVGSRVLQIVPIAQAGDRARLEPPEGAKPQAPGHPGVGFISVVHRLNHRSAKEVIDAIKPLLSEPGGAAVALGSDGLLLLSDLEPRVAEIVSVIKSLDMPGQDIEIVRLEATQTGPIQLAASVTAAVEARNALVPQPLLGKIRPLADDAAVLLIAPSEEVSFWKDLVARLDTRPTVETRSYTPRHFAAAEVAQLIEQAVKGASTLAGKTSGGGGGSGERWRLVTDALTGTLIITATPAEHDQIDRLIDRLDSMPAAARQPIRTFQVKNRSVSELVAVLNSLMQQGVLEAGELQVRATDGIASPTVPASQQSQREVLPPSGSLGQPSQPILPPSSPRADSALGSEAASAQPSLHGSSAPMQPSRRTSGLGASTAGPGASRPLLSLTADEATNTLIAVGEPRLLTQLEGLLRVLDVRQPQVMLEAMVISLNDADTLDLGVELQKIEISGSTIMSLSSIFGLGIPAATSAVLPNATGSGFTGLALNPGDFSVLIRALQTLNNGRALSMPKVLVNNNQDATLDAVLQQPFTSTNASTTVATTSFGGTQDAGTTITVKPQIASGDELVLTYSVALSSFVGESSDPNIPPPRQQNTVSSVVRIPDGYTIVVGGLELTTDSKAVSQIPLLGSIPLVGELFKSRSNSDSTTRFYVFIRAAILRHEDFEDLKYLSDRDAKLAEVSDGWPEVKPRLIR